MTFKGTTNAPALVISCEHGGNQIPSPYRRYFRDCHAVLASHRGFDPGALAMARALARFFGAPLLSATVSRLLVDLNRSIGHRHLHMDAIRALPAAARQQIIDTHYAPYRAQIAALVEAGIAGQGRVLHIACHSFTPQLDGEVRRADIGLLYDPARADEQQLCAQWKSALGVAAPDLVVRRNYPYLGRNDGLMPALRKNFPPAAYLGIELELNQKHLPVTAQPWLALRDAVMTSLEAVRGDAHP